MRSAFLFSGLPSWILFLVQSFDTRIRSCSFGCQVPAYQSVASAEKVLGGRGQTWLCDMNIDKGRYVLVARQGQLQEVRMCGTCTYAICFAVKTVTISFRSIQQLLWLKSARPRDGKKMAYVSYHQHGCSFALLQ